MFKLINSFTNDEDISLRLSTRRAEERLRQEEHQINMELMRQRVRVTPLLLEGQTALPNTLTAGAHRCDPTPTSYSNGRVQSAQVSDGRTRFRNVSALSNYTDSRCGSASTKQPVGRSRSSNMMRRLAAYDGFGTS